MRLRRFSQLGWLGCQDLAGFVMGEEVERVELGPPPLEWDDPENTMVLSSSDKPTAPTGYAYVLEVTDE